MGGPPLLAGGALGGPRLALPSRAPAREHHPSSSSSGELRSVPPPTATTTDPLPRRGGGSLRRKGGQQALLASFCVGGLPAQVLAGGFQLLPPVRAGGVCAPPALRVAAAPWSRRDVCYPTTAPSRGDGRLRLPAGPASVPRRHQVRSSKNGLGLVLLHRVSPPVTLACFCGQAV